VVDTVVVGGGHAGLAMSYCLTEQGVDHLVLEAGMVARRARRVANRQA
jgi:putative flavoprotein involved in K+ transport